MFDAQKLLGGLLGAKMGNSGGLLDGLLGGGQSSKLGAGLGILGVAMAAFQHFAGKAQTAQASQAVSAPPAPPSGVMPPPSPKSQDDADAMLLIRAMIAAANADGTVDNEERNAIIGRMDAMGLSGEERNYIMGELYNPASLDEILSQVDSKQQGSLVYAVSLIAINPDTPEEQEYLVRLVKGLNLDRETVARIWKQLEG